MSSFTLLIIFVFVGAWLRSQAAALRSQLDVLFLINHPVVQMIIIAADSTTMSGQNNNNNNNDDDDDDDDTIMTHPEWVNVTSPGPHDLINFLEVFLVVSSFTFLPSAYMRRRKGFEMLR